MKDKTVGSSSRFLWLFRLWSSARLTENRVKDQKANQYQSFNEALIDLKNDRIDALLIDRVYANYYLQSEGILNDYNVFSLDLKVNLLLSESDLLTKDYCKL